MDTNAMGSGSAGTAADPAPALSGGDDGKPITVGSQFMDVGSLTMLANPDSNTPAGVFDVHTNGTGSAISGSSAQGIGVYGESGQSKTSVAGVAGFNKAGVAVAGQSSTGTGVFAVTQEGTAMHAVAGTPDAIAVRIDGRLQLPQVSGVATYAVGGSSVLVSPHLPITANSFVLLTPCSNLKGRSLWYVLGPGEDGTFAIWISNPADAAFQVAWLLVG